MLLVALAALSFISGAVSASEIDEVPHLFHRPDGSVIARWIVDNEVYEESFRRGEPIRLTGFDGLLGTQFELAPHAPDPAILPMPERVFVLGDVEGEYKALVDMLRAGGVIDDQSRWSYGRGHLVSLGDMVDRGEHVTEVLWLMYRLEREAEAAGGAVHFLLGNHEVMYMGDDVRYTAEKYVHAANLFGISTSGLVGPDTELGRWLRSRNTMLRLGDVLFVHAGVSLATIREVPDIESVNRSVRSVLGIPKADRGDSTPWTLAWSRSGPMWYRGYFPWFEDDYGPVPDPEQMAEILTWAKAEFIVVGHSRVEKIALIHDGAVLVTDIPWTNTAKARAVVLEDGKMLQCGIDGVLAPVPHLPVEAVSFEN